MIRGSGQSFSLKPVMICSLTTYDIAKWGVVLLIGEWLIQVLKWRYDFSMLSAYRRGSGYVSARVYFKGGEGGGGGGFCPL